MCSEYSRESARGSHPSRRRHPRGCRGAERPTPAPSETKAVRRTACVVGNECLHQNSSGRAREGRRPLAPVPRGDVGEQSVPRPRRRKQSRQENSLRRRKRMSPPEQLRESARGPQTSRPSSPRGCRGAERPTPAPSETKAVRRTACIVGNEYLHQNSSGRAREGRTPLAPRHPRGCRGVERPTLASSETKPSREQPAPSETNISTRTAPGERERVTALSPPSTEGV